MWINGWKNQIWTLETGGKPLLPVILLWRTSQTPTRCGADALYEPNISWSSYDFRATCVCQKKVMQ
jgi:hypothetical protein